MMVQELKIKVTKKLMEVIQSNLKQNKIKNIPQNIKDVLNMKKSSKEVFVSVEDIKWLHSHIVKKIDDVYLHELISESDLVLPEPEVLPRNPELEARCRKLKAQQEDREYRNMTKNVDPVRVRHPEDTIGSQIKQINRQLIAVFQFIMSVGAGFVFGFIGIELIVGDLDFGFRLLLGVICALIIALAEIYFLAKKLADDLVPPTSMSSNVSSSKTHQD